MRQTITLCKIANSSADQKVQVLENVEVEVNHHNGSAAAHLAYCISEILRTRNLWANLKNLSPQDLARITKDNFLTNMQERASTRDLLKIKPLPDNFNFDADDLEASLAHHFALQPQQFIAIDDEKSTVNCDISYEPITPQNWGIQFKNDPHIYSLTVAIQILRQKKNSPFTCLPWLSVAYIYTPAQQVAYGDRAQANAALLASKNKNERLRGAEILAIYALLDRFNRPISAGQNSAALFYPIPMQNQPQLFKESWLVKTLVTLVACLLPISDYIQDSLSNISDNMPHSFLFIISILSLTHHSLTMQWIDEKEFDYLSGDDEDEMPALDEPDEDEMPALH